MTDFATETCIRAVRRPRPCDACGCDLEKGKPAIRWAGSNGGDVHSLVYHVECREAELALNRLHPVYSTDDWYAIRDIEWEDWPWLVDEHPICAKRCGITARKIADTFTERERVRSAWASVGQRLAEKAA